MAERMAALSPTRVPRIARLAISPVSASSARVREFATNLCGMCAGCQYWIGVGERSKVVAYRYQQLIHIAFRKAVRAQLVARALTARVPRAHFAQLGEPVCKRCVREHQFDVALDRPQALRPV